MILHIHNLYPNLSKNNPKKGYNITGNNNITEDSHAAKISVVSNLCLIILLHNYSTRSIRSIITNIKNSG